MEKPGSVAAEKSWMVIVGRDEANGSLAWYLAGSIAWSTAWSLAGSVRPSLHNGDSTDWDRNREDRDRGDGSTVEGRNVAELSKGPSG